MSKPLLDKFKHKYEYKEKQKNHQHVTKWKLAYIQQTEEYRDQQNQGDSAKCIYKI